MSAQSERTVGPFPRTRRRFLLVLAAATGSLIASGCSVRPAPINPSSPTSVPRPAPTTVSSGPTPYTRSIPTETPRPEAKATATPLPRTLSWWTTRSDSLWVDALKQSGAAFVAQQPRYTVEVSGGHADFGKLVESFAAEQGPDVVEPGDMIPFAARGLIRPLDQFLKSSTVGPADYLTQIWSNGLWNGVSHGIPALDHGAELGLIWNRSLVGGADSSHGLPSTWDDLYSFGTKYTRRATDGSIDVLGFDPLDGVGSDLDTVRVVTGQEWFDPKTHLVTFDNPAYETFIGKIVAYYQAIGTDHLATFRQGASLLTSAADSAMNLGKEVAILSGYWSVGELTRLAHDKSWQFEYGWVPAMPSTTKIQRVGGRVLSIPSVAKNPDGGWASIEYLAGEATNQLFFNHVGTCTMTNAFLESDYWKGQPGIEFFVQSISQSARLESRSNNTLAGFAQTKWFQTLTDVLNQNQAVPDALKAAQTALQIEAGRLNA
ncbi:MAG TPA: extracellular solute-binding protein [Chloroflexota bacterium]|nr:extracellular solute-binding protein [Chloroflexota bacterium]